MDKKQRNKSTSIADGLGMKSPLLITQATPDDFDVTENEQVAKGLAADAIMGSDKMKPLLALSKKEPVHAAVGLTSGGDGAILLDKKAKTKTSGKLIGEDIAKMQSQLENLGEAIDKDMKNLSDWRAKTKTFRELVSEWVDNAQTGFSIATDLGLGMASSASALDRVMAVIQQVPPKVEYCLTDWGQALCPALDALLTWASQRDNAAAAKSEA